MNPPYTETHPCPHAQQPLPQRMLRLRRDGVELKCRHRKRMMVIPWDTQRLGITSLSNGKNELNNPKEEAAKCSSRSATTQKNHRGQRYATQSPYTEHL
jgi:hypothetical protein